MTVNLSTGILAGGRSSRMGSNKAFLKVNGEYFIDRLRRELSEISVPGISVGAGDERYSGLDARLLYDEHKDLGPIEGIRQLLKASENDWIFCCSVDLPGLKKELPLYLAEFISSDYDCICPVSRGRIHPLAACYSRACLAAAEEQIRAGDYRLKDMLGKVRTKYVDLDITRFDSAMLENVNTPEDLAAFESRQLPSDGLPQIGTGQNAAEKIPSSDSRQNPPEEKNSSGHRIVFCVSGVKNSGKTTMIVKMLGYLRGLGYKVSVVKHDGHDFEIDYPDTDSWRFTQAGAERSIIYSPVKAAVVMSSTRSTEELIRLCTEEDIVILEGQKFTPYPKVEIVRSAISDKCVTDSDTMICAASDLTRPGNCEKPVFDINDIAGICDYVLDYFRGTQSC